jgi:hypothetical protein
MCRPVRAAGPEHQRTKPTEAAVELQVWMQLLKQHSPLCIPHHISLYCQGYSAGVL